MTGQDIAILALLQLALLVTAMLAVHTAYAHGYQQGWDDRQELDPWHRMKRAAQRMGDTIMQAARHVSEQLTKAARRMTAEDELQRLRGPRLYITGDADHLARELATYRMHERASMQVDAASAYLTGRRDAP